MNTETKLEEKQSFMERFFERGLWATRYVVILAVIFSVLSAISLFIIGSYEIMETLLHDNPWTTSDHHSHSQILSTIIGAVDLYLIGVVLLIFAFGIYELFVSKIDIARRNTDVTILEVENIDELKNKIIKVIIMVLIVSFFERVLNMSYETPLEMMYFAISIFALAFGVYLLNKKG
jgi:uncharacterized protein (TIGR00645 family)